MSAKIVERLRGRALAEEAECRTDTADLLNAAADEIEKGDAAIYHALGHIYRRGVSHLSDDAIQAITRHLDRNRAKGDQP